MFSIKVLAKEDVEALLKMEDVIPAVESVYVQKAKGEAVAWPVVFYEFNPGVADMDIKSGWLQNSALFGLKLVSFFGENADKGLPTLVGVILVCDGKTGQPLGLLDGSYITGIRTGAAGAIGAKYLANPDAEDLLIVGAGHVAFYQVAASLSLMPKIRRVRICDPIDDENAKAFAAFIRERLLGFGVDVNEDIEFMPVDGAELAGAVAASAVIITVTPSKKPLIRKEWVSPGTHFSCIGADMAGKEEIDPEIFADAKIFCDDIPHCVEAGETEIPLKTGIIKERDIAGEIGAVITGQISGRESREQITVFDATGMALLDLATAKIALDKAEAANAGTAAEI